MGPLDAFKEHLIIKSAGILDACLKLHLSGDNILRSIIGFVYCKLYFILMVVPACRQIAFGIYRPANRLALPGLSANLIAATKVIPGLCSSLMGTLGKHLRSRSPHSSTSRLDCRRKREHTHGVLCDSRPDPALGLGC